jgi:hypothetical protein
MKNIILVAMLAEVYTEQSWDKDKKEYGLTRNAACDKACKELGMVFDTVELQVLYLLIHECWNEIQDWFMHYFTFAVNIQYNDDDLIAYIKGVVN